MLGLRHELADRHVFDHAPAQRADGLVGHGGAPVLSEVVEHLDLRTGRFHRLRLLIITPAAPQAPYRERFSPMAPSGGRHLHRYVRCWKKRTRGRAPRLTEAAYSSSFFSGWI